MREGWEGRIYTRQLIVISLAVLAVALLLAVPGSGSAGLSEMPYRLVPGMTSSVGSDLRSLATDGSLIVWEDGRNGHPDAYAYDLSDNREFRVSSDSDIRRQPAVSGSTVVWVSGQDPKASTIRGVDLAEGVEFAITDEPAQVDRPAISDDLIVWKERIDAQWVIQIASRSLEHRATVGEEGRNSGRPTVSGSQVVWQEHDGESWNLRLFDAETGSTSTLTDGPENDQYPLISADRVVFVRAAASGGNPQLILLDIATGDEQVLHEGHYFQRPAIYGDLVVWEDWRSGLPDIYAHDLEHGDTFAVARSQQASAPVVSGRIIAWISGNDPSSQRVQALEIQQRLPTDPQEPPAVPSPDNLYIPETQHFVSAGFKAFWQAHGGPQFFGYPLTEEFVEEDLESGEDIVVQYFERVKLEFHPDAPEDSQIRLARLGFELRPERDMELTEPFEDSETRRYFDQTGYGLSFGFKEFWEDNGGVGIFGFPVTDEIVENGRTVQYFERARFEFDPESEDNPVRLGLLGREALQDRGWLPLPPLDTTQIFE